MLKEWFIYHLRLYTPAAVIFVFVSDTCAPAAVRFYMTKNWIFLLLELFLLMSSAKIWSWIEVDMYPSLFRFVLSLWLWDCHKWNELAAAIDLGNSAVQIFLCSIFSRIIWLSGGLTNNQHLGGIWSPDSLKIPVKLFTVIVNTEHSTLEQHCLQQRNHWLSSDWCGQSHPSSGNSGGHG